MQEIIKNILVKLIYMYSKSNITLKNFFKLTYLRADKNKSNNHQCFFYTS